MKNIIAVLITCAAVAFADGASAQLGGRWIDPTGSWSIDFSSSRWGSGSDLPPDGPILLILPATEPRDNEVRICFAEQIADTQSADAAEAAIALLDAASAARLFPRAQLRDVSVTQFVIGDHAVAAVQGLSRSNEFRARAFITRAGDQVFTTTLSCILTPGMNPVLAAEVDSILQTLQFATVDTHQ